MPTRDTEGFTVPEDMWEGMIDPGGNLIEPPDDDETSVTRSERAAVDVSGFWNALPVLRHIHDFAVSQRVGPWAVFGAVLARIICQTHQAVQLPNTIASYASLNLFVGLVGESGDGKDGAQDVAADAVYIENERFKVNPLGSGEGLSHMFMRQTRATKEDPNPDPTQYNQAALVTVREIATLGSLMQRQAATVTSQLLQAAMGQGLGFFYADASRKMIVPAHQYRLCLIAGIQPAKSGVLLHDSAGGTPQRFVWLPAGDPNAQREVPDPPTPLIWTPPDWTQAARAHSRGETRILITLPEICREAIIDARVSRLRGEGEKLDSHAVLTRTKVASGIAIMDGRINPEVSDWELSGVVMAVSDAQRARCLRALEREREKVTKAKALEEADRSVIVEERIDKEKVIRCVELVRRKLETTPGEWVSHRVLSQTAGKRLRAQLEPALDLLSYDRKIETRKADNRGQTSLQYRSVRS